MRVPNPVILEVVGDEIVGAGRVQAIIWTGATTLGDTIELNNGDFWRGRTDTTQTYLGAAFPQHGVTIPNERLRLTQISAGRVYVYILEA